MIIFVDIDNTICSQDGSNYGQAEPFPEVIGRVNRWFYDGNRIVYWTARGTETGIDWRELTEGQLERWGCKYHELRFGKPSYDLFIDDKSTRIDELPGVLSNGH